MATLDRPQLRRLSLVRFDHQGRSYALIEDPLGVFSTPVLVPLEVFLPICRHFDGRLSLEEIRRRVETETGKPLYPETLERLVVQLDQAMVLDGPTFASFLDSYRRSSRRPAALAGRSYAADEALLRDQLTGYFQGPGGAAASGGARTRTLGLAHPKPKARPATGGFAACSARTLIFAAADRFTPGRIAPGGAARHRHIRNFGGRSSILPPPIRADLQRLRNAAGARADRSRLCAADCPGRRG